jgi:hypothetical protein
MDADPLAKHWERARTLLRVKWERLTDADVVAIGGGTEMLAVRLAQRYGWPLDRARVEAHAFAQEFEQAGETSTEPTQASIAQRTESRAG